MKIKKVIEISDSKLNARVNHALYSGKINLYVTTDGFRAYDEDEFNSIVLEKRGRKCLIKNDRKTKGE